MRGIDPVREGGTVKDRTTIPVAQTKEVASRINRRRSKKKDISTNSFGYELS